MSPTPSSVEHEIATLLDGIAAVPEVQSNCMFQLALMLARIAVEPCPDGYKDETGQALLALIRAKPKSNVVRLFGAPTQGGRGAGAADPRKGREPEATRPSAVVPLGASVLRS